MAPFYYMIHNDIYIYIYLSGPPNTEHSVQESRQSNTRFYLCVPNTPNTAFSLRSQSAEHTEHTEHRPNRVQELHQSAEHTAFAEHSVQPAFRSVPNTVFVVFRSPSPASAGAADSTYCVDLLRCVGI